MTWSSVLTSGAGLSARGEKKEEGRRGMRAADGLHARGRKLGRGWAGWLGLLDRAALSIFFDKTFTFFQKQKTS